MWSLKLKYSLLVCRKYTEQVLMYCRMNLKAFRKCLGTSRLRYLNLHLHLSTCLAPKQKNLMKHTEM